MIKVILMDALTHRTCLCFLRPPLALGRTLSPPTAGASHGADERICAAVEIGRGLPDLVGDHDRIYKLTVSEHVDPHK